MHVRAEAWAPGTVAVRSGVATSVGHRRHHNEDALLDGPEWFVVADGMGGHLAGDVASAVAVETFASVPPGPRTVESIRRVVDDANTAVVGRAHRDGTAGMGTTLVGTTAVVDGDRTAIAVFHVGDSRCYRLLDGELALLTTDHSHVQELLDAHLISPVEAVDHPLRNVVTRALGVADEVAADVVVLDRPGRLLLCSDGLSGELDARSIGRVLCAVADPQAAADRLVAVALAGAARDNVSALVVDYCEVPA